MLLQASVRTTPVSVALQSTIYVDGVPVANVQREEVPCAGLAEGPHVARARFTAGDLVIDSNEVTFEVDGIVPTLESISPAAGGASLSRQQTALTLTFSEPMVAFGQCGSFRTSLELAGHVAPCQPSADRRTFVVPLPAPPREAEWLEFKLEGAWLGDDVGNHVADAVFVWPYVPNPVFDVTLSLEGGPILGPQDVRVVTGLEGEVPESVVLTVRGPDTSAPVRHVVPLSPPGYEYVFAASTEPEGVYSFQATATLRGETRSTDMLYRNVDHRPPSLRWEPSSAPPPGCLRSGTLRVDFDEGLDPATILPSAISVTTVEGAPVPSSLSQPSGDAIEIAWQVIAVPSTVRVRLLGGVSDLAGNPTLSRFDWSCAVPEWLVYPPYEDQRIGSERRAIANFPWIASLTFEETLPGAPSWLGEVGRWVLTDPAISVRSADREANVLAYLRDEGQAGWSLRVDPFVGSGWLLPPVATGALEEPTSAFPLVGWLEAGNIQVARHDYDTQAWFELDPAPDPTGLASAPDLLVQGYPLAWLAWLDRAGPAAPPQVRVRRLVGEGPQAGWGSVLGPLSSQPDSPASPPFLVGDPDGSPVVLFLEGPVGGRVLRLWRYTAGGFQQGPSLAPAVGTDMEELSVYQRNDGQFFVSWVETGPGVRAVETARWTAGSWARLGSPCGPDCEARFPLVSAQDMGAPVIAWTVPDGRLQVVEQNH